MSDRVVWYGAKLGEDPDASHAAARRALVAAEIPFSTWRAPLASDGRHPPSIVVDEQHETAARAAIRAQPRAERRHDDET